MHKKRCLDRRENEYNFKVQVLQRTMKHWEAEAALLEKTKEVMEHKLAEQCGASYKMLEIDEARLVETEQHVQERMAVT